jgi:hypothetical protein
VLRSIIIALELFLLPLINIFNYIESLIKILLKF